MNNINLKIMSSANKNSFSILTNDCIFELLRWLPLNDLCALSGTCKRLKSLSENHFRRKYRNEVNREVNVGIGLDGKLRISPNKEYMKAFRKFIKNVHIYIWTFRQDDFDDENVDLSLVTKFIKAKCDENMYRIFIEGDIVLFPFCKQIKKYLRSVEEIVFGDRHENGRDEAKLLKYCPNLTKLILQEEGIPKRNIDAIFELKYRKLQHFYYINSYASDLRNEKLKMFFQQNETIKTVAWRFHYYDDDNRALDCLQTVDYALCLEHLYLLICRLLADKFDSICSYLTLLCDRSNFKYLEIEFDGKEGATALKAYSNRLANLKQLKKIHLTSLKLTDVIPALRCLLHLKTIVLTDLTTEDDWDVDLDDFIDMVDNTQNIELPHIEEIHLVDIDSEDAYIYITQFARHFKQLKRILLPECMHSHQYAKHNISRLDTARQKLKNACELTIFTNHPKNATNCEHILVKLKHVEFGFNTDVKDATAFQRYHVINE